MELWASLRSWPAHAREPHSTTCASRPHFLASHWQWWCLPNPAQSFPLLPSPILLLCTIPLAFLCCSVWCSALTCPEVFSQGQSSGWPWPHWSDGTICGFCSREAVPVKGCIGRKGKAGRVGWEWSGGLAAWRTTKYCYFKGTKLGRL